MISRASESFGPSWERARKIGILRDKTIFSMEQSDWYAVIAVHLKGDFCCAQPFARYIRETRRTGCRIVNFSSVSGLFGNFGQSNYGAATRLTLPLMEGRGAQVDLENPLVGPQQIAPVVTWLASPKAQDVTAQILHVSRGQVAIMQQPALIRAFQTDHLWSQDDLDHVIPALLQARRVHDERAKRDATPEPIGAGGVSSDVRI
jgi:hypothetical protein